MPAKVLFLHGLESKQGGQKPKYLEKCGYVVLNPALPKYSFDESVEIAQDIIDKEQPDIIVGSSRGGAVAMHCKNNGIPLVLIAPAWKRFGAGDAPISTPTSVLHCRYDDIVEYDDSKQLAENDKVTLISCGESHRMNDSDALSALLDVVKWHLK